MAALIFGKAEFCSSSQMKGTSFLVSSMIGQRISAWLGIWLLMKLIMPIKSLTFLILWGLQFWESLWCVCKLVDVLFVWVRSIGIWLSRSKGCFCWGWLALLSVQGGGRWHQESKDVCWKCLLLYGRCHLCKDLAYDFSWVEKYQTFLIESVGWLDPHREDTTFEESECGYNGE